MRCWRHSLSVALTVLLTLTMPGGAAAVSPASSPAQLSGPAVDDRTAAIDLRVTLGRLLGEHSFLLMEAMRSSAADLPDQAALTAALADNSAKLQDAIASVYGDEEGRRFGAVWVEHVELLIQLAEGTQDGDEPRQRELREQLDGFMTRLADLLADLSPEFSGHEEAAALKLHIEHVTAFADNDYARAYAAHREAFEHMFVLGDHLALGMARQFPERFAGGAVAFSPRSDLRLTLDRLLGEHMVLAAEAMRAGITDAPDFEAARRSLDQNTTDLSAAVASVYGPAAGSAFKDVWSEHLNAYIQFVTALAADDSGDRASSLESLHAYHDRIAEFLATASPQLDREAVAGLIRRHVQALITQAEATAEGDPERAVAATREGYDGTFEVGAALADAIAAQFPEKFRDLEELPQTSTAPPAEWVSSRWVWILALGYLLLLSLAAVERGTRRAGPAG